MLGRRGAAAVAALGATAFTGGAVAATHSGSSHPNVKPKPAKPAPAADRTHGGHHCHLDGGAGIGASV